MSERGGTLATFYKEGGVAGGDGLDELYTVPPGSTIHSGMFTVASRDSSPQTFRLAIVSDGAATADEADYVCWDAALSGYDSIIMPGFFLGPGDQVRVWSSGISTIRLFGLEVR